ALPVALVEEQAAIRSTTDQRLVTVALPIPRREHGVEYAKADADPLTGRREPAAVTVAVVDEEVTGAGTAQDVRQSVTVPVVGDDDVGEHSPAGPDADASGGDRVPRVEVRWEPVVVAVEVPARRLAEDGLGAVAGPVVHTEQLVEDVPAAANEDPAVERGELAAGET